MTEQPNMTKNEHAYNDSYYSDTPLGDDNDILLLPFNQFKKQTQLYDYNFKNKHSDVFMTKVIDTIKKDVDNSHGHLNEQFELIDYLSRSDNPAH